MSKIRKFNRTKQQIKEQQISFLLEDAEKNLEEYKKVVYQEEPDSEPELEEEEYSAEEIEEEPEIKKPKKKAEKRKNNISDYINKDAKRHKR